MWLSLRTTRHEQAIAAYTAIQSGQDKVIADTLAKMSYGNVSINRKFENWNDKDDVWTVEIHAHTFRGGIPFKETAKHLLDTYPGFTLDGRVMNDCFRMYEYDREVHELQSYMFDVGPEDWPAFLAGDYANTTQGRIEIERRKNEEHPKQATPKTQDLNKDDELPF